MTPEANAEFEFTVWSLTGRDMPSIDNFLSNGESSAVWDGDNGAHNRARLLELREEAFQAFESNDMPLMKARVADLFAQAEAIGYRFSVHKNAVIGAATIEQRKAFGSRSHDEQHTKHSKWLKWQKEAIAATEEFAKKSKMDQARVLKARYNIEETVGAIAKRLAPLPDKK